VTFTVKIAVLAAVVLGEAIVAAIVAPRLSKNGNPAGALAILGSAVVTVAVVGYVLFAVIE
jgi:hypothetical protein